MSHNQFKNQQKPSYVDQENEERLINRFADALLPLIERFGYEGIDPVGRLMARIRQEDPGAARYLLEISPSLIERLLPRGEELVLQVYGLGNQVASCGAVPAVKFLQMAPEILEKSDFPTLAKTATLVCAVAETSLVAAGAFIDVLPALIDRVGLEGLGKIWELALPIARESFEAASRFLLKSPDLIDRLGLEGLKVISDFSALLARESWSAAVQLFDKCPRIIDGLLKVGEPSLIFRVCRLGDRIARTNARLAVSLLESSPEIIAQTGFTGLEKLEELAYQIGLENWTTAVSLMDSSSSLIERVGFEGLKRIAAVARTIARENSYAAVSLLEKSPDLLDRLQDYGDSTLALHIYDLAAKGGRSSWRMAVNFLEKSPEWLSRIGAEGLERLFVLINQTAQNNAQIATRLLNLSLVIIDPIGFKGLEVLSDLALLLSRTDRTAALSLLEKSPLLISRLEKSGDRTTALTVFELAAGVAGSSPAVASRLLEKSPELVGWVGLEGFGMIAAQVENTARVDEEKALSFLANDSPALTDFMENIPKGLELKTVKPVLSTYLRALLGRRVEIVEAEAAYTDGMKIYLPGRVKDFQDIKDNFAFYKVAATHQEGHLEYGSFEFDLERMQDSLERIRHHYGYKKINYDSDMDSFCHLFPEPDLVRDLFNILEDFRIDGRLENEYPSLGADIARINHHRLLKRRSPHKMTNPKQRVVEIIGQSLIGGRAFDDEADPVYPIYREAQARAKSLLQPGVDVHQAARIAFDLYRMIDQQFKEPYHPEKPMAQPLDQDMVSRNIGSFGKTSRQIQERISRTPSFGMDQGRNQPEVENGSEGETQPTQNRPQKENIQQSHRPAGKDQRSFQGPAGGGKEDSGEANPEAEETDGVGEAMKFDSGDKIERLLRALYRERGITPREIEQRLDTLYPNEIYLFLHNIEALLDKKTELQIERGTSLYPEWGEDINDYRANWARVREQTLQGRTLEFYREALDRYAGLLKKIRREFQVLKPEGITRLKRQYDGDDIDLDAVVEYRVDRKVGLSPDEKNYRLTLKKKRDIAVALLVDMSRSTKGATIEREKESIIILSEALHEVGDAFAVYGFSGDNRDNVDYYRVKDFEDLYDDQVKKRISAITDRFENRDGTAIRHTIIQLRKRPERTKMIILLSDGKPMDKEYSGPYAIEDTRMALKEAQPYGIKTFCITVDRAAAEYLPRMYSHSSWTVIDDVTKLPEKITRIYRSLTS
ncbi:MAG: VWA domain-containing protein [Deltaproteobacteria bacterium]|nr:VWA domain-containing protein [Deltaproteobacteria bacterium]